MYNDIDLDDLSAPKVSTDFTTTDGEESSNQSADIIAETKYRLKSLEKEATVSWFVTSELKHSCQLFTKRSHV